MFNGKLEMKSVDILLDERGLDKMGDVQKFIDKESITLMKPYTPMDTGFLSQDAPTHGTVIGSGLIEYNAPYDRFQYYGKVMVYEPTGSTWAPSGGIKVETDKELQYNVSKHPQAGPFWFERMKADYKDEILKGAQKIANGEA